MTISKSANTILADAIKHIRRTHMNTRHWTLPIGDEIAIFILEQLQYICGGEEPNYDDKYMDVIKAKEKQR